MALLRCLTNYMSGKLKCIALQFFRAVVNIINLGINNDLYTQQCQ